MKQLTITVVGAALVVAATACKPADRVEQKAEKVGEEAVERDVDLAGKQETARRAEVKERAEERADAAQKTQEDVADAEDDLKDAVVAFQKERARVSAEQGERLNKAEQKLTAIEQEISAGKAKMKVGYDGRLEVAKGSLKNAHQEVAGLAGVDSASWEASKKRSENAIKAAEAAVDDVEGATE